MFLKETRIAADYCMCYGDNSSNYKRARGDMGYKRASSVVTARVIVAALGCLMIGASIYAFIRDGSPFHMEVFTPCMITLLIDVNIHIVVFSVWIAYKESSWITAFFWILLLSCFGSIGVCAYILRELFCLSPEQPIYLILFSKSNRNVQSSDPLLMAHTGV
uniref:Uncharacterized protein n=1 Tax=Tanacetum cinerariifolium TaxID=118510 RepID=A0A6L2P0C7_TANCI|nr:uncharacterized protein [Tanacetum cinerariifolium]